MKVLVGMVLGIVVRLAINLTGLNADGSFVNTYFVDKLFHIVGKMFVNALTMLVVPLVLFSLICGVCGIGDVKLLGRISCFCRTCRSEKLSGNQRTTCYVFQGAINNE
ncbi:MAG: cation:dicarboxylase symporter family transporter [Thiohalocapsa sp.]